jgi:hypothetical protein
MVTCTFTLDELLQSDDEVVINVALAKEIKRIVADWLSQDRSFAKPNGPTAQELLEELEE